MCSVTATTAGLESGVQFRNHAAVLLKLFSLLFGWCQRNNIFSSQDAILSVDFIQEKNISLWLLLRLSAFLLRGRNQKQIRETYFLQFKLTLIYGKKKCVLQKTWKYVKEY